jgi:hypothetical protein
LLLNPIKVASLLAAIKDSLTLDQHTSINDLEKLAIHLRGVAANQLVFATLPTRGITLADTDLGQLSGNPNAPSLIPNGQTQDVGNVLVVEPGPFATLMAKLKDEKAPPPAMAAAAPKITTVSVAPSAVYVTVQNGVGRSGLAGTVVGALRLDGFQTSRPHSADHTGYPISLVRYAPGNKEAALSVQAAIPGSDLKEDPTVGNGIILTLGDNYSEVKTVQVMGQAAPVVSTPATPAAAPTTAAPVVTAASAGNRCTY